MDVDSRLDQAASLARPRTVEPLPGGLTNLNFRVTTPQGRYVARLSGSAGEMLTIDRDAEHANSRAAAAAGVAPQVTEYVPAARLLVIEWIEGRTLDAADLDDEVMLGRIADTCRQLHAGPAFRGVFDMFDVQQRYLDIVRRNGFRLPAGYLELAPQVEQIRRALAVRAVAPVPCHNDLLPANMIDDGQRIRLIDYEYSGMGDACFELGNIWSEASLPPERLTELVTAYHGRHSRSLIARARLLGLIGKYGWTLWAAIQDGSSPLDFDFWSWGMEKYDRAVAEFAGPELATWLDDVQALD